MLSDVRNHYGLARDFGQAGYFETEHSEQIVSELKLEIKAGHPSRSRWKRAKLVSPL